MFCIVTVDGDMNFLISETFTDSLARLTGEEQKAVKTTAFDLQLATGHQPPATSRFSGMGSHKFDRARQERRVSMGTMGDGRCVGHGLCSGRPVDTGRDPSKQQEAA